ncbi:MAG: PEP-CTERM sorting domain-containing protein [Cyanobacteria bacterium J06559_3]
MTIQTKLASVGAAVVAIAAFSPAATAAVFQVPASDGYFTFAGNISENSDVRLLSDKATVIGFEGFETLSFLQFDLTGLPLDTIETDLVKASLLLEHDSDLAGTLIPATADRPVSVSAYGLTAPFDDVNGNVDDIDFGVDGANAIATTSVGADGVYSWDLTDLISYLASSDSEGFDVSLNGVFGNVNTDDRNTYASFYPVGATAGLSPQLKIQTVPEPASVAALMLLGSGLFFCKKRRARAL